MRTITGNIKAHISTFTDRRELVDMEGEDVLRLLIFSAHDMTTSGYAYAGEVKVRVDLLEDTAVLQNQVEALKEEQKAIQAHASRRLGEIQERINALLSLEFVPAPADDEIPF